MKTGVQIVYHRLKYWILAFAGKTDFRAFYEVIIPVLCGLLSFTVLESLNLRAI